MDQTKAERPDTVIGTALVAAFSLANPNLRQDHRVYAGERGTGQL
jgi:hypothetical protein